MVSAGLKSFVLSVTRAFETARPTSTSATATVLVAGVAAAPGATSPPAAFCSFEQAVNAANASAVTARTRARRAWTWTDMGRSPRSGARNFERLSRIDEIRVLDRVLVRFVDPMPLRRIAVLVLRDLGERIPSNDGVG